MRLFLWFSNTVCRYLLHPKWMPQLKWDPRRLLCCRVCIKKFSKIQRWRQFCYCFSFGVCCLFVQTSCSGSVIEANGSYVSNPGFPQPYTSDQSCTYQIAKQDSGKSLLIVLLSFLARKFKKVTKVSCNSTYSIRNSVWAKIHNFEKKSGSCRICKSLLIVLLFGAKIQIILHELLRFHAI